MTVIPERLPVEPVLRTCSKCKSSGQQTIVRVLTQCVQCHKVHDHAPGAFQIVGVLADGGVMVPIGDAAGAGS